MGSTDATNPNAIRTRVLELVANRAGVEISLLEDDTDIFRYAGIGHDFEIDYQGDVFGLVEDLIREFDVYWLEMRWERHFPDTSEPIRFSNLPESAHSFFLALLFVVLLPVALVWPRIYVVLGVVRERLPQELPNPIAANLLPDDYLPITVADLVRVAEHRLWECRYDSCDEEADFPRISPRHLDAFLRQHRSRFGRDAEDTARPVAEFVAQWRGIDVARISDDTDLHHDLWIGAGLARWAGSFTDYEAFFHAYRSEFEVAIQDIDYRRHFPAAFAWQYWRLVWAFPCYLLAIPFRFFFPDATERSKQWLFHRLDRMVWKLGRRWSEHRRVAPEYLGITVADLIRAAQLGLWRPKRDRDS